MFWGTFLYPRLGYKIGSINGHRAHWTLENEIVSLHVPVQARHSAQNRFLSKIAIIVKTHKRANTGADEDFCTFLIKKNVKH